MGSLSRVCVSLLTADWRKGTEIKTSVNCLKGSQTDNYYRGEGGSAPLCLHSHPSCQQHIRKNYAAFFSLLFTCLFCCRFCYVLLFVDVCLAIKDNNCLEMSMGIVWYFMETCSSAPLWIHRSSRQRAYSWKVLNTYYLIHGDPEVFPGQIR